MSKMSELSLMLDSLVDCGEKLTETAKALKAFYSAPDAETTKTTAEAKTKQTAEDKAKKTETKPDSKPSLSKEDVRLLLSQKASMEDGKYKAQVKDLVKKYANGGSLSDVPAESYEALKAELEVIGDA